MPSAAHSKACHHTTVVDVAPLCSPVFFEVVDAASVDSVTPPTCDDAWTGGDSECWTAAAKGVGVWNATWSNRDGRFFVVLVTTTLLVDDFVISIDPSAVAARRFSCVVLYTECL